VADASVIAAQSAAAAAWASVFVNAAVVIAALAVPALQRQWTRQDAAEAERRYKIAALAAGVAALDTMDRLQQEIAQTAEALNTGTLDVFDPWPWRRDLSLDALVLGQFLSRLDQEPIARALQRVRLLNSAAQRDIDQLVQTGITLDFLEGFVAERRKFLHAAEGLRLRSEERQNARDALAAERENLGGTRSERRGRKHRQMLLRH